MTVHVEKPVDHCYYIWLDRLNYLNWFDLISEVMPVKPLYCLLHSAKVISRHVC